jgi:hypothetical protein
LNLDGDVLHNIVPPLVVMVRHLCHCVIVGAESSPTLTSKSTEICPSMAGAKQLVTLVFILVPVGAVRPALVCSGHYIASHRDACRGVLQERRERRLVLQVPEVLIEASANIGVKGGRR